ncbi:MAG: hypothetical protein ACP5G1_04365 [Nanopusillaceae archaeon]
MCAFSKAIKYIFYGTTLSIISSLIYMTVFFIIFLYSNASNINNIGLTYIEAVYMYLALLLLYFIGFIVNIYGYVLLYTAIYDYNKEKHIGSPWAAIISLYLPIIGYFLLYGIFKNLNPKLRTPAKLLIIPILIMFSSIFIVISLLFVSENIAFLSFILTIIVSLVLIVIAWGIMYERAKKLNL